MVLANLGSEKAAQEFVKKYKGTPLTVSGCSLTIHHARIEFNTKRNTVLRKATEAVRTRVLELDKDSQAKVETKWGNDRAVTVDSAVVFQQNKTGVSGYFTGAFADLTLP